MRRATTTALDLVVPGRWCASPVRARLSYRLLVTVALTVLLVTSIVAVGGMAVAIHPDEPTEANETAPGDAFSPELAGSSLETAASTAVVTPSPFDPESSHATAPAANTTITLVTGDQVRVIERDGERIVSPVDDDASIQVFSAGNGTYAFPTDVDLSTYDPSLFHIDLLLEQGLTDDEAASIPVIVQGQDIERQYLQDDRASRGDGVGGLDHHRDLHSIGAMAAEVEKAAAADAMAELHATYNVSGVYLDREVEVALDRSVEAIAGETARADHDVNGSGVTVAVLDTGVDAAHPDLQAAVVDQFDTTGDGPGDRHGHGTHVAGTIAGDGSASDGTYVGVAPGAAIIDVKVLGDDGAGELSGIIEGMELAADEGADVISMSLGGPAGPDDPFVEAVEQLTADGVLVVAAAGNDGDDYYTTQSPAAVEEAMAVGAVQQLGHEMAGFSSRGPTPDHWVKPDLVAPGVDITAPSAGDHSDDGYVSMSGTSMAAPHVSGAAALMLEADESLDPETIRNTLRFTADPLEGYDIYAQGSGQVNVTRAIEPDLRIDAAAHSLGPVTEPGTETRLVTLENPTDATITLEIDERMVNVETGADWSEQLEANVSTLEIPGGDTADLRIETDTAVPGGIYSGTIWINATDRGLSHTVPVGMVRGADVTVEKEPYSDGGAVEGDTVMLLTPDIGPTISTISDGQAAFILGDGSYTVWSPGFDEPTDTFVFTSRSFAVDGETTVSLDERETEPFTLDDGGLPHELATRSTQVGVATTLASGEDPVRYETGGVVPGDVALRFSPDDTLDVALHRIAVPADQHEEGGVDVDDVYLLSHAVAGVEGAHELYVTEDDLITEERTYYRSFPDERLYVQFGLSDHEVGVSPQLGVPYALGDRHAQSIHMTEATWYLSDVATETGSYWVDRDAAFMPDGGEAAVNRGPLTGAMDVAVSEAGVEATGVFMADQAPVRHPFTAGYNQYVVLHNGEPLATEETYAPGFDAAVDAAVADGDTVTVASYGQHADAPLSSGVEVVANVTYAAGGDNTPPAVSAIDLPLDEHNVIEDDEVTVSVPVESSDGIAELAVLTAAGDVTSAPDPAADAWHEADTTFVEADEDTYWYDVTLDLTPYEDRAHLVLYAEDGGGDHVFVGVADAIAVDAAAPDPGTERITGTLTRADGDPAVNDTIVVVDRALGEPVALAVTNETGHFDVEVVDDRRYDLTYLHADVRASPTEWFPRDGNVDLHALARVNLSTDEIDGDDVAADLEPIDTAELPVTFVSGEAGAQAADAETIEATDGDLGAITLPAGHVLTTTVTDWEDDPVAGARVAYLPQGPDGFDAAAPVALETDATGQALHIDRGEPGLELAGEVAIETLAPPQPAFVPRTTTAATVTEPTDVTVGIDHREIVRVPEEHETIQDAVDAAPEHALILVADDTAYAESVTIEQPVAIVSNAAYHAAATVGAPDGAPRLTGDDDHEVAFHVASEAGPVFIEGFELQSYDVGVNTSEAGTDHVGIRDNSITDAGAGIAATAGDGWVIERNRIVEPDRGGILLADGVGVEVAHTEVIGDGETEGEADASTVRLERTTQSEGTMDGIVLENVDAVELRDNTLSGSYAGAGIGIIATDRELRGVHVANNSLSGGFGGSAVLIGAAEGGVVRDGTIAHNEVDGLGASPAIGFRPLDADAALTGMAVHENAIRNASTGIGFHSVDDGGQIDAVDVAGNAISETDAGIVIGSDRSLGDIYTRQNDIDRTGVGIVVETPATEHDSAATVHVGSSGNAISNATYGLVGAGPGSHIVGEGGTIADSRDGLVATANASIGLEGTVITRNAIGINASHEGFVAVNDSEIAGNERYGAFVADDSAFIDATNNWWGHETGPYHPDHNPDGMGDTVTAHVTFEPWIGIDALDPRVADYANEDDVIDADGLRAAVSDWRSGDIDTQLLRDVVDYWRSGEAVDE